MFLVCQKEERARRAFEAVLKSAEDDKKFARLVSEKAQRVLSAKRKTLRGRMAPSPTQKTVERLTRKIWEFSEEVRAASIAAPGEVEG